MRLITNEELLAVAGGEDGFVVYDDDLGGFLSIGDFGGGKGDGKGDGKGKAPAPKPPKCTETVTTVEKEQVITSIKVGITEISITKSDGGKTTTISRTCNGK